MYQAQLVISVTVIHPHCVVMLQIYSTEDLKDIQQIKA